VLPTPQNTTKISQFNERIDKKCGVWCKWVQCSVMGDLKQTKIMSLRSLIVAFCLPNTKKFCETLVHTCQVTQSGLKIEEDMGLELERGLELFA
jgi:hypothetical protein